MYSMESRQLNMAAHRSPRDAYFFSPNGARANPPFSIKDKVLERLYSFNKPFAILLPLNSLQGKTRYKYFKQGIQILSFDARVCYHDKNHMDSVVKGSPFATAYFCRDLLPKDLIVEKLVTYERPLMTR